MMMIVLFTVLSRNKLRIPLEERCDKISGLYPSCGLTTSLGASVGSPPGRAVYGHILANAEPFSASVSRYIGKSVRLRKFPLRWLTFCLLEARPFPSLPPAHLHVSFVQGLICGLAIDHIPGP